MKKSIRLTESQLKNVIKRIIRGQHGEEYQDWLDTNYDADGLEDAYYDKRLVMLGENLYEAGNIMYQASNALKYYEGSDKSALQNKLIQIANDYRQEAIKIARSVGWDEKDLPSYDENDKIQSLKKKGIDPALYTDKFGRYIGD
jgi:hypothetical protein